ncbi:MAG: hypothetical protein ABSE53_08845 [Terracidiphilus sp.]|jgi:hypothetical protein
MRDYSEFHDGAFEGLWIDGKTAHLFLATEQRERFVIVAEEVAALTIDGVRAGNIVFEVLEREPDEIGDQDIQILFDPQDGPAGETQGANLLEKARLQHWRILEINPSYGATCLVLAGSLKLLRRKDWFERFALNASS